MRKEESGSACQMKREQLASWEKQSERQTSWHKWKVEQEGALKGNQMKSRMRNMTYARHERDITIQKKEDAIHDKALYFDRMDVSGSAGALAS